MALTKQKIKSKPKPPAHAAVEYNIRLLTSKDVKAFTGLQDRMLPYLTKAYHLKPKTAAYLKAHIASGMHILGAFHIDGTLVAATILTDPTNKTAQLGEYPVKDCATKVIVFQSFMIDPLHQGKGLSHKLDDMTKSLYPYADFMAKIATDNKDSLDSFVGRRNFEILEEVDSKDVRDGTPYKAVFVFRESQSLLKPVCSSAAQADVALPTQNA
jgi:hypothetical protein